MNPSIVCIGDSCVDHYEAIHQKFPGGNPVNYAVYLRRLGVPSSFVGAVGTKGQLSMERLACVKECAEPEFADGVEEGRAPQGV